MARAAMTEKQYKERGTETRGTLLAGDVPATTTGRRACHAFLLVLPFSNFRGYRRLLRQGRAAGGAAPRNNVALDRATHTSPDS